MALPEHAICPATRSAHCSRSPPSARATGPRWAASSTAVRPVSHLSEADLQPDVDRRRTGTSQFVSQRSEGDEVRILSGVFEGRTTGTPIGILIENTDARSRDYEKIKDRFRPGPRRLHLSAEIRLSRLSRRRAFLRARDRHARRGRRHRAQVSARAARACRSAATWRRSATHGHRAGEARRPRTRIRSSVRIPRACRSSRSSCGRSARGRLARARTSR